jgi:hypothetical protein
MLCGLQTGVGQALSCSIRKIGFCSSLTLEMHAIIVVSVRMQRPELMV